MYTCISSLGDNISCNNPFFINPSVHYLSFNNSINKKINNQVGSSIMMESSGCGYERIRTALKEGK